MGRVSGMKELRNQVDTALRKGFQRNFQRDRRHTQAQPHHTDTHTHTTPSPHTYTGETKLRLRKGAERIQNRKKATKHTKKETQNNKKILTQRQQEINPVI